LLGPCSSHISPQREAGQISGPYTAIHAMPWYFININGIEIHYATLALAPSPYSYATNQRLILESQLLAQQQLHLRFNPLCFLDKPTLVLSGSITIMPSMQTRFCRTLISMPVANC
uniref:Uncharacterized protein n=1 Tax=Oncorhynchus kisutch TaxID=8019 RepID=A0A8C7GCS6_ONCKI